MGAFYKAGYAVRKGLYELNKVKPIGAVTGAAKKATSTAAHYTGKLAKRAVIKNTEKSIVNPLGIQTTKLFGALAVGGVAAWGIAAGSVNGRTSALQQNAEYAGNMPQMDYDAVPNVDRMTGKRDFGATGDLVFGLNKANKSSKG